MQHPEIDNRNPFGYSVHWQAITDRPATVTPWLRIIFVSVGSALICFGGGYFLAQQKANEQIEAADRLRLEAENSKKSAAGDLAAAELKISEQGQRLRKVNDCVYSALNEALPAPPERPIQ